MSTPSFLYLDLCTPLFFSKINDIPVEIQKNEEFLFFYELDSTQGCSIEPVKESLLKKLISIGQKKIDSDSLQGIDRLVLPAGKYLITQQRGNYGILEQKEWLNMAVEQQKDGIWEHYKLINQLYVRYLFEDNQFVTQLLRPGSSKSN